MFPFLEQIILCNWLIKAVFKLILSRNWHDRLISQLGKEMQKELLLHLFSVFHFIVLNLKWSYSIQQWLVLDKVVKKALFMRNFSNFLVFGTNNLVQLINQSSISNKFEQELVTSSNLSIIKRSVKGAPAWTISAFYFIIFKFRLKM